MTSEPKRIKLTPLGDPDLEFAQVMQHLMTQGYAVVPGVVSEEKCDEIYGHFMKYMEDLSCGRFDRNDRTTWIDKNMPITTRGLVQHFNVGFQRHAVEARKAVKPVFEKIFKTTKLTTSFDGTSFTRPPKVFHYRDLDDFKKRCWEKTKVHIDQTTLGYESVQGGLAITDQEEDEHVFVCVPQSHLWHDELLAISEREVALANKKLKKEFKRGERKSFTPKKLELHWSIMGPEHVAFLKSKGLEMKRVPLKRGDFVLWQSRLVHASAPYCKTARPDSLRVQVFVSMAPAVRDDPKETAKRIEAYEKGVVSKHSADRIRLFGKTPRLYGKDDMELMKSLKVPPSAELSEEEKLLHGLVPYPESEEEEG
jgi:ectoine hydroxylase-related dioxygenase (phytanoyl-CoA dioxygenase family)